MKFDVDKFKKDTNYSDRYSDWDSNLQKMNKLLDEKPISEGSKHYWYLNFSRHKWVKIGFDDQGNIFCEYLGRPHKNEKVNVVNEAQIKFITETFLKFLSVFDEFGYILHSANTRIDEREVLQMTSDEIKKVLECCIKDDCDNCPDTFGNCEHNAMANALVYINKLETESNHQHAKIEALKMDNEQLQSDIVNANGNCDKLKNDCELLKTALAQKIVSEIKSDAIKEFADGLKAKAQNATTWTGIEPVVTISDIEDTAKKW